MEESSHEPTETEPLAETSVTDGEDVTEGILRAVARATGTRVVDLPPLYDDVDPDALSALANHEAWTGAVRFRYAGHTVFVHGTGRIEVEEGTRRLHASVDGE